MRIMPQSKPDGTMTSSHGLPRLDEFRKREEGLQGALSRRALCRVVLQRLPLGTRFVLRTFRAVALCPWHELSLRMAFCELLVSSSGALPLARVSCFARFASPGRVSPPVEPAEESVRRVIGRRLHRPPREHDVRWFRSQLAHIWSEPLWDHSMDTPPRP